MRLVGHLRALEHDVDGLIHFVGPITENVQAGARLVIVPATLPTSTDADFQVYASAGPPAPAKHVWTGCELPVRCREDADGN